jgi:hypothetical protein
VFWFEPGGHNILNHILIEPLATENIEVSVPRVIAEMSRYITGLYQLDKGKPCLISFPKVLDQWPSKGFHIDALDQVSCEQFYVTRIANSKRLALTSIDDTVATPV